MKYFHQLERGGWVLFLSHFAQQGKKAVANICIDFMVISESVKQKEMLSEKTKNLVQTLELWSCWDRTLILWSARTGFWRWQKGKVFALGLEKDLSPLELHVTAGVHLKSSSPSAGQARAAPSLEFERLPGDPIAGVGASRPRTRRAACLSSHPKSQDFVAFLEVKGLLLPSHSPNRGMCPYSVGDTGLRENCFGDTFPVRRAPYGPREGRDPDPREASPAAARGLLRQRARPLARPHSPLR